MDPNDQNLDRMDPNDRNLDRMDPNDWNLDRMDSNDRHLDRMDPNDRNIDRMDPNDRNLDRMDPNDWKDPNDRNLDRMDPNDRDGPETGIWNLRKALCDMARLGLGSGPPHARRLMMISYRLSFFEHRWRGRCGSSLDGSRRIESTTCRVRQT
ncbi:hypothetical protein CDL15_Pgr002594 [Punica granatum]|uniref:Uncharacterized protein n=1 Tax=Punica granatum TaxID=22663 RepID=A0A218WXG5_PUNGR|nr:hypothetical protein CDL15_Pgr002594 [Punica granatum]PKI60723.1 hypothetical protein CRG98_018884 [Punica granatum]